MHSNFFMKKFKRSNLRYIKSSSEFANILKQMNFAKKKHNSKNSTCKYS